MHVVNAIPRKLDWAGASHSFYWYIAQQNIDLKHDKKTK